MSSRIATEGRRARSSFVRDRAALFAELAQAVQPDSPSTVLIVVGFEGLKDFLEEAAEADAEQLLEGIGDSLVLTLEEMGTVFASRRGEFCILCEGGLPAVRSLLVVLPSAIDEITRPIGARSSLGIAVLPDEATIPTYALALADRRIRALSGDIRAKIA
jgi:hypothetical protein